jgi:hypothetical protein
MAIISDSTFDPLLRYVNVRLQQGVPIVDADINELDDIRSFEVRAFLKWFVGDGVPEGSDAFRIVAADLTDDVVIDPGVASAPAGMDNVAAGLGFTGRLLIDGRDAIIRDPVNFRDQLLHDSQAGAAALAVEWGVPTVPELPVADTTVRLYLDAWDRLVTPTEEPDLIFQGLGTESAARMRREWVVRWTPNPTPPAFGDGSGEFIDGHSYVLLAEVVRRAADPVVRAADVTDLRERRLLVPPATLVEDLLGTSPRRYRQGLDRPAISLREGLNALLRGELPSTPDAPIATDPGDDDMSFAFDFAGSDVVGFWHSNRVAAADQVFAVRWPQDDPAAAATAAPVQVTSGGTHRLPHALQLPGGDFLVVYESNGADIHFRRASTLSGLSGATETAVADTAGVFERHPYVVRAGDQLVFLWHRQTPGPRWMYRRRQYGPAWDEAGASWLDGAGVELSPITPAPPSPAAGEVHAVVGGGQVYVAFTTDAPDIAVLRLDPATAAIQDWSGTTLASPDSDGQPYLVVDGSSSVWALWRGEDAAQSIQGVFLERYDVASDAWAGSGSLVPGTDSTGDDSRPVAVRDALGALWLFWVSSRSGGNDLWLVRRNPDTGGWGEPRQVVAAAGDDDLPFARIAADEAIWLFWRSQRAGQFDLFHKRLITAI